MFSGALPCRDGTCSGLSSHISPPATSTTITVTTTSSAPTVTSSATNMASSVSSVTPSASNSSSSSLTNTSTVTNATSNNDNDDTGHKSIVTQCHRACNGIIRNTSYPTLSSAAATPQSVSDQTVKKSVSTVFSSNNRNSWQLSLSNYGPENTRRECSASGAQESHEHQVRSEHIQRQGGPLEDTLPDPDTEVDPSPSRHQSKVFVYPEGPSAKAVLPDDRKVSHDRKPDLDHEDVLSYACREERVVGCSNGVETPYHGERSGRRGSDSPMASCCLMDEESGSRRASCSVQSPRYKPDSALTWCSHLEPHQLRQQANTTASSHSHSHSRSASCGEDYIELSLYQLSCFSHPDIHSCAAQDHGLRVDPVNQHPNPSGSTSQNCDQSVSVQRTSDQSGTVSFSSHGKRKDSERAVRYSSDSERTDGHQRRRSQHVDFGGEKRVHELSALSTDCPPDTQPLLYMPRVRVEGASRSGSPDMCVDNTLVRFHSLDSKESHR